jgi:hypothetical protein
MARLRSLVLLPAVALLLALGASPARADPPGLGVGDVAVDFEGKDFVNTEPISLKSLRGHVVLLELFSTT